MDLIEQLTAANIITQAGTLNKKSQAMLAKNQPLMQQVVDATSFLDTGSSVRARLFAVRAHMSSAPTCKTCGELMAFNDAKNRFNEFCPNTKDKSCSNRHQEVIQKYKDTMIERHGVDSPAKSDAIRAKRADTVMERYGGTSPMASQEVRDAVRQSQVTRYGSVEAFQHAVSIKRQQTNTERYGATTFAGSQVPQDVVARLSDRERCIDMLRDFTVEEIAESLDTTTYTVRKYLTQHNLTDVVSRRKQSSPERMIVEYLQTLGITCQLNDRSIIGPKHLDIYIPQYNLAIEYDGIFYHSELQGRGRRYHSDKTVACNKAGVRLIHVFSSEWEMKRSLVLSRIANAVSQCESYFARKGTIRELTTAETRAFFDASHIQGYVAASVCYGMFFGENLIAAMSFGISRFNSKYQWELLRYSSKVGTRVVGGASRLFQWFVKQHQPFGVISYCDLRWGTGNMYEKIGFTYMHTSPPNYYYFKRSSDTNRLLSRQVFQKHKLAAKLDTFDPNMTEWENMVANGYDRIWDCGNSVYGWRPQ